MCEALLQSDNCFVTLTYSDEFMPEGGSLVPSDLQLWLKRLRALVAPRRFRFYGAGEYGENTERPHYHVCLFGYAGCMHGKSTYSDRKASCCVQCDRVRDSWGKGNIFIGELNDKTAQYTAGYVLKKLNVAGYPALRGRHPEFSRQSRRPGIGAEFVKELAKVVLEYDLYDGDVPSTLRHGRRVLPLGRYMMRKLRKELGYDEKAPQAVIDKCSAEMRPMFEAAKASVEVPGVKKHIVEAGAQRRLNMATRRKIRENKKGVI